ncbi:MAG: hypothetical protein V4440_06515 [Pseudomonadota bacterium]
MPPSDRDLQVAKDLGSIDEFKRNQATVNSVIFEKLDGLTESLNEFKIHMEPVINIIKIVQRQGVELRSVGQLKIDVDNVKADVHSIDTKLVEMGTAIDGKISSINSNLISLAVKIGAATGIIGVVITIFGPLLLRTIHVIP